jgi:hypothetical protein
MKLEVIRDVHNLQGSGAENWIGKISCGIPLHMWDNIRYTEFELEGIGLEGDKKNSGSRENICTP